MNTAAITTARSLISALYLAADGTILTSYRDPYGEVNAVKTDDGSTARLACIGAPEADDDGALIYTWCGYAAADGVHFEIVTDTGAGHAGDVLAEAERWLRG